MSNEQPRKPIQDIMVPHQELLRRPVSTTSHANVVLSARPKEPTPRRIENNPFFAKNTEPREQKKAKKSGFWFLVLGVVVLLAALFGLAVFFSSANIELTPISKSVVLDHEFSATANLDGDNLVFEFVSFSDEKTKEIPATVEQKIQKKASGKVLIYNSYSATSQRLIKNTRLESSDHKIFRIDESVVVPGAKVSTKAGERGKIVEPGKVEVVVYADVPGKEYNIGLGDFTIPGFKGDPRYTKFTARSNPTSLIGGGFSGTIKVPSESAVTTAQNELREELKKNAIDKSRAQIPENKSFFPGSVIMKFEEVPQDFSADSVAKISLRASTSIFFFDTESLTKKIIGKAIPQESAKPLAVSSIGSISFAFLDPVDNVVLSDLKHVRFKLSGEASFVGNIDTEKLRALLAGKTREESFTVIKNQNNVEKMNFIIRPFWQKRLPLDPQKIFVKVLIPN
ncbi:MAG: hypothetical protein AAB552_00550 [Patescibacteria group bacterium]